MNKDYHGDRKNGLKGWLLFGLFPWSLPWLIAETKDKPNKPDKPKSDDLSTCGCLIVFIAIILLIAVCAA